MEKHEGADSNNEDIEDIEVDVVSTATPSVTEIEDGDSNHKDTTQEKSDQATETGDGCPPDLVSSISDSHYDPTHVECPNPDSTPIQLSDQSHTDQLEPDHITSNCTSTSQDQTSLQTSRQRSGSVSETADAQSSGSHGDNVTGNHVNRNRSESFSHVDSQESSHNISKPKKTTTNFRIVDIVQLPRPRNPGGVIPLDNETEHEALDLIVNERRGKRTISQKESLSWTSANNDIIPISSLNSVCGQTRRHSDIGSYGISLTTSNQRLSAWSSSINETVERPQPSSVVDNEGVAKKIARLDSTVSPSIGDDLWLGRVGLLPNIRTTSARTPPERPKVPRRQFSPLVSNTRTRQVLLSPGQQRGSPLQDISPTSETSRLSTGSISQSIDVERLSPESSGHQNRTYCLYSPDDMVPVTSSRNHKCRNCNYSTTSYTQLQFHLAKHSGSIKALKCPLCDYMTSEKSNFKRHRRLHSRSNPTTLLKCGKCSYATTLPYKIREHYQQVHNEGRITGIPTDVPMPENAVYGPPQRLMGSRSISSMSVHHNPCDTLAGQVPYLGYTPLMMNGHSNTYPYPTSNRQPSLNSLDPYMNTPYGVLRGRQEGQNSVSNYLRSVMPSAVNSHSTPRQATSTLTSSDYFISPVVDNSHVESLRGHRIINNTSVSNTVQSSPDVKVKVEPIDVDNHSDVSSTATGYNTITPDITCQTAEAQPSHQPHIDSISTTVHHHGNLASRSSNSQRRILQTLSLDDSNIGQVNTRSHNIENILESNGFQRSRPGLQRSRSCTDVNGSDAYNSFSSSFSSNLKFGSRSVGIQCILPIVKTEKQLNGDFFHCRLVNGQQQQIRDKGVERGVQCNMNSANRSNLTRQHGPTNLRLSADGSDLSEHHSSIGESRCSHCGIVFEDEVMFSIHIGCHSHTDPFICNICGKHCGNKYGFYSHIMRGHHF